MIDAALLYLVVGLVVAVYLMACQGGLRALRALLAEVVEVVATFLLAVVIWPVLLLLHVLSGGNQP